MDMIRNRGNRIINPAMEKIISKKCFNIISFRFINLAGDQNQKLQGSDFAKIT